MSPSLVKNEVTYEFEHLDPGTTGIKKQQKAVNSIISTLAAFAPSHCQNAAVFLHLHIFS